MVKIFCIIIPLLLLAGFKEQQQKHERVQNAYREKESVVHGYFREKNLATENFHMFVRAFKHERSLEVWVKPAGSDIYQLLHTYPICAASGSPGPKRREGDMQVPEGVYFIQHFNPTSNFYLSLGIDYPNASDRLLSNRHRPGGAIYIHGGCVTIGCIPLTDDKIKELYVMAVEARDHGQEKIPVHIFPAALSERKLQELVACNPQHAAFWKNLQAVYADFENGHKLRTPRVDSRGAYVY